MANTPGFVLDLFLSPGEHYFGDSDTRIRTILGSCVSMTLWHPYRKIGGMNHVMLPTRGARSPSETELDGRYADESMELLLAEIKAAKAHPSEFEVKIFGGGDMLAGRIPGKSMDIGRRNIDACESLLSRHGFRVVAEHLGGLAHRQIIFEIWSGDVWMPRQQFKEFSGKK